MKQTSLVIICLLLSPIIFSQIKADLNNLKFELNGDAKIEQYKNQECILTNNGDAKVLELKFEDGVIEFDMCVQQIRGFAGVRFRGSENSTEEFYIRMHQSGNPDAMQYTPVYNGNAGWQLYHGDGYSAVKNYKFDEWFHIRIAVNGTKGEVYIEDMDKPVLVIHELKLKNAKGNVTFYGPARFANIKILETVPMLKSSFKEIAKAGNNVVKKYRISEPFDVEPHARPAMLDEEFVKTLKLTSVETEADGLLNISKKAKLSKQKNAVLLQYEIKAEEDLVKVMNFGFSDAAKVYVNGQAVWIGMDTYRSRDYRFLGTIGYFDSVYMPLKKGENTISIIVMENFGGWGFKSKFDKMEGISLNN